MTTIARWLEGLGLGKYAATFADAEIDLAAVPHLTDDDLKELRLPLGPRRKILAAATTVVTNGLPPSLEPASPPTSSHGDAERRQLTVMFCDLVGSTALASGLDPEDLRQVLGAYHAAVAEVVDAFGGYVAKYMGDGVLAYFGYPQAHEHDAEQAVRAGLALIDRVRQVESSATPLASRVSIATGLVIVGDLIGSGEAQERGVVGETPNLAARLQELAPTNAVMIADNTRRLVGDLFEYRDLGAVAIRGLARPVLVSQVLTESSVENRFEALRSRTLSPLVGRDEEVQTLLRRWTLAKEGEGQIVLISGEAGIGKSRIVAELQERLEPDRPIHLRHFCSPHRRESALFPIVARLERAAGFLREDSPATRLDKLAALLSRFGDVDPETEAAFAVLLALPVSERHSPLPDDPRQKRELILSALVRQLQGLAQHRPILFLFEDAHWIDSTSFDLLDRIAEHVRRLPVLMVVTCRPEFEPPWIGQAQVTSMTLSRLGHRQTKVLVGRVAGDKTLPAEILDRIVERADGIPLCIEELTRTLLEGNLLQEERGHYILSGPLPTLAVPSSLHDSLVARLDRLGAAKEVAQIGAAVGREFSWELVTAVAQRPDDQVRDALNRLVQAGLVFARGAPHHESFVFKHALVQDAAYGTLLRARRHELHARIAEVLEEQVVRPLGDNAPVREGAALLAHHWFRAEAWEKALACTLEAAERAQKLFARPEAINHSWRALELIERLPPTPERNHVQCDVIMSLYQLPGWMRDEHDAEKRMLRHVDRALALAIEAGQIADTAKLETVKAVLQVDEALFKGAIVGAESSGDPLAEAVAGVGYGGFLSQRGRFEAATVHATRVIEIWRALGEEWQMARQMARGARCFTARGGKIDQSIALAARAREAANTLNDAELRAWCAMEAEPYLYKGLWAEAVAAAEEALPGAWKIGEWTVVFFSSAWLALACLKLGQLDKAQRALDRVFNEAPVRNRPSEGHAIPYAQIARAQVHLAKGHHSEALSTVRQALAAAQRGDFRTEEVAAHRVLGLVYEAIGDRAEADAAFRRSLAGLDEIQCPPELAQTLLAYGRFRRGDNTQEDRAMIEHALRLFKEMKATGWIEEARVALAAASPV